MSIEVKYIPKTWKDLKGNEDRINKLRRNIDKEMQNPKDRCPHILLVGPPGTGKTSTANVVTRAYHLKSTDVKEINLSLFGRIEEIRGGGVGKFMNTASFTAHRRKILIGEEIDNMSKPAQQGFRRDLETKASNVLCIFTANDESKIHGAILDRCFIVRMRRIPDDKIVERMKEVASSEDIEFEEEDLVAIAASSNGQMRHAIKMLGVYEKGDDIAAVADESSQVVKKFLNLCMESTMTAVGSFVVDVVEQMDMDERQFLKKLLDHALVSKISEVAKRNLIVLLGETDFRIANGAHPKIGVMWLAASFIKSRKRGTKKPSQR